jgi:hypothetical protein
MFCVHVSGCVHCVRLLNVKLHVSCPAHTAVAVTCTMSYVAAQWTGPDVCLVLVKLCICCKAWPGRTVCHVINGTCASLTATFNHLETPCTKLLPYLLTYSIEQNPY